MNFLLLIIILAYAKGYYISGYDCENADFVMNLTTSLDLQDSSPLQLTKASAQIVQNIEESEEV